MKLDKVKYLKRVIAISWLALLVCCIIKMFGGNFFVIMCENERFIAVCEYADTHFWANYLISCLYCFVSLYFFILAVLQETKFTRFQLAVVVLTVIIGSLVKIKSVSLGWIFDIWQMGLMPIIFLGKNFKRYWRIAVAVVLLLIFQVVSMMVKDIRISTLGGKLLIDIIFSLDVLLMEILYFAYSNFKKKEDTGNG